MGRGFYRFVFWLNVIGVTDFLLKVLVFRIHQPDINYVLAFLNTMFAWKWCWPKCEYDTTWYYRFVRICKWRFYKWKNRHK